MQTADALFDEDALLPGDVAVDMSNHRPFIVSGRSEFVAADIPIVWKNATNQWNYDIEPDDELIDVTSCPTGSHYFVPDEVLSFPLQRLDRFYPEAATGGRRPQADVVRTCVAHVLADLRSMGGESVSEAFLSAAEGHWPQEYVDSIRDLSEAMEQTDLSGT